MSEKEIFILADQALNEVVAQIKDDQWTMDVPPDFARSDMSRVPALREIVNYHAYDDAWVPDMLAGRTMDEVGKEEFKGDLLGDDPKGRFADLVVKACAAARDLDDLDRTVHCSFGDFPARDYLVQITMFRGLRARDIAKAIGSNFTLSDELVQGLWDEISPKAEQWREIGVFAKAVAVPDNAPLIDRLVGLTGRKP